MKELSIYNLLGRGVVIEVRDVVWFQKHGIRVLPDQHYCCYSEVRHVVYVDHAAFKKLKELDLEQ